MDHFDIGLLDFISKKQNWAILLLPKVPKSHFEMKSNNQGISQTMKPLIITFALSIIIVCSAVSGEQRANENRQDKQAGIRETIPPLVDIKGWTTNRWTGNDKPYKKTEQEVTLSLKTGKNSKDVIQQEEEVALKSVEAIRDRTKVYAWAFAVQKDAEINNNLFTDEYACRALAALDIGDSYEYTRLHFLLIRESFPNSNHADLAPLGERLLKRNPQDLPVKVSYIYDLCTPKTIAKAQDFTESWVRQEPHSDSAHLLLAFVYQDQMVFHYSRAYADKSIAEYQAYLRYAAPSAPSRTNAEYLIEGTKKIRQRLP